MDEMSERVRNFHQTSFGRGTIDEMVAFARSERLL